MRFFPELMQPLSTTSRQKEIRLKKPVEEWRYDPMDDIVTEDRFSGDDEGIVDSVIDVWKNVTSREVDVGNSVKEKISTALSQGDWENQPWHYTESTVRSAAYLPPEPGDEDEDVTRLINVLTDEDYREWASELSLRVDCPPFLFDEIGEMLSRFDKVVKVFPGVPDGREESWTVWKLTDYPLKKIRAVVDDLDQPSFSTVLSALNNYHGNLFPSVSSENQARHKKKVPAPSDLSNRDISVVVYNDLQARDMLHLGHPEERILDHHNNGVPEGYWDRVDEEVMKGVVGDLMDIYDHLEDEFNFHPEDRDVPELM